MSTIYRFEDLEIWKEARTLSKEIIKIVKTSDLIKDFKGTIYLIKLTTLNQIKPN